MKIVLNELWVDPDTARPDEFTTEEVLRDWRQSCGELLGMAAHLERKGSTRTATQLRMLIQLANSEYNRLRPRG